MFFSKGSTSKNGGGPFLLEFGHIIHSKPETSKIYMIFKISYVIHILSFISQKLYISSNHCFIVFLCNHGNEPLYTKYIEIKKIDIHPLDVDKTFIRGALLKEEKKKIVITE